MAAGKLYMNEVAQLLQPGDSLSIDGSRYVIQQEGSNNVAVPRPRRAKGGTPEGDASPPAEGDSPSPQPDGDPKEG